MSVTQPHLEISNPLKPSTEDAAERLSANCFFNALLRETDAGAWVIDADSPVPDGIQRPALRINLPASQACLWLSVTSVSYTHLTLPTIYSV